MRLNYIDNIDCLEGLKDIPDKSIDLIVTDPPYFLSMGHAGGTNVWRMKAFCSGAKTSNGEKIHPTQKPWELIAKAIEDSTEPGAVVLDTFMGSGTTAVACLKTGRNYIGFKLDEKYHAIAMERVAAEEPEEVWMT